MKELKEMQVAVSDFNEAIDAVVTTMRDRASSAMSLPEHGSPEDRGSADAYYQSPRDPHYWQGPPLAGIRVPASMMTQAQIDSYNTAYFDEKDRKDYG